MKEVENLLHLWYRNYANCSCVLEKSLNKSKKVSNIVYVSAFDEAPNVLNVPIWHQFVQLFSEVSILNDYIYNNFLAVFLLGNV